MTPNEILVAYARVVEELRSLRMREKRRAAPIASDEVLVEAKVRVQQALYALLRFRENEAVDTLRVLPSVAGVPRAVRQVLEADSGTPELEFYAEVFYLCAFRAMKVFDRVPRFKIKAPGVRDVRNHLIEHADRPRGVMKRSYAVDVPQGFIIKPFRAKSGLTTDRGLYPNAEEFVVQLRARVREAA